MSAALHRIGSVSTTDDYGIANSLLDDGGVLLAVGLDPHGCPTFVVGEIDRTRCADGSRFHHFKGEPRCPACGHGGLAS